MDDEQSLDLLSTLNYVVAGLILLVYAALVVFFSFLPASLGGLGVAEREMLVIVLGILMVPGLIMNILSGIFLRRRTHRMYCIIHAALQCLSIPIGLALGVFTLVVLNRESVRLIFERDRIS